jgi:hypothetical protein
LIWLSSVRVGLFVMSTFVVDKLNVDILRVGNLEVDKITKHLSTVIAILVVTSTLLKPDMESYVHKLQ